MEGKRIPEIYENPGCDVLVIAGDLHVGADNCLHELKEFAKTHEHVIYVSGNHEYYKNSIEDFDPKLKLWTKNTNIHFLNPGTFTVRDQKTFEGVTFIGATLWTNFGDDHIAKLTVPQMINDFRLISNNGDRFSADHACALYEYHALCIKGAYSMIPGKKVIVTHFLPDGACTDPQYKNEGLINKYFANNLGEYISDLKDTTWLFGHTHSNVDITIGNTRCIANPYGYKYIKDYREKIIEI